VTFNLCLQCFDVIGCVAGKASGLKKLEWCGTGVVICLERGADLHMAQLMPLSLASVKSRLVLPFWYWLTWAVLGKGPLNGCVCVCGTLNLSSACCVYCTVGGRQFNRPKF